MDFFEDIGGCLVILLIALAVIAALAFLALIAYWLFV